MVPSIEAIVLSVICIIAGATVVLLAWRLNKKNERIAGLRKDVQSWVADWKRENKEKNNLRVEYNVLRKELRKMEARDIEKEVRVLREQVKRLDSLAGSYVANVRMLLQNPDFADFKPTCGRVVTVSDPHKDVTK
jgi:chromosome segregation ATPase